MVAIELSLFAIVVFAAVVCFLLTWSIGANDVANTFGTSVGAKVLTVKQACLIAAIFEFLGAFLMGSHVAETFREKLLFTSFWENEPSVLAVGMTASMIGAFFLITLATFFSLPVSGTHAILGAVIGFAIVSRGYDSVQWGETFFIISGWMLSPLLAGATAFVMFWLLRRFILRSEESFKKGIQFLPICYGTTVSLVALFILFKGSAGLDLSIFPTWMILTAVLMAGLVTGVAIWCFTPCIINWAEKNANSPSVPDAEVNLEELEDADPLPPPSTVAKEVIESSSEIEIELTKEEQTSREVPQPKEGEECSAEIVIESGADIDIGKETKKTKSIETEKKEVNKPKSDSETKQADEIVSAKTEVNEQDAPPASEEFDDKTEQLFSMGQVLMAIVGSFAHGANDIANAIGPFAVVIGVYNSGSVHSTGAIPWWILVMGGVGIVTGLAMWGYKVIKTIGERLTKVTPSRGFNIELGSAITVMGASRIGIPLSTTHCKVGAVIGVGLCDGGAAVQWKMVGNVAVGWFVTLPIAGAVSAAFFLFLSHLSDYS